MSMLRLVLDNWVLGRLAEPFDEEDVKWIPAFGGGKDTALAYIDVRTVTNRLNEVVGGENWSDAYVESTIVGTEVRDLTEYDNIPADRVTKTKYKITPKYESDKIFSYNDIKYGGIRCNLTVLGVTKSDVGVPSFAEQLKGAYSDSLKRAAVKFGIGEYFYRLGTMRDAVIEYGRVVSPPKLPDWALPPKRPDADKVIRETIEKVHTTSLSPELSKQADEALRHILVMGSYNPLAPLVVKRAVYEELTRILKVAQNGS